MMLWSREAMASRPPGLTPGVPREPEDIIMASEDIIMAWDFNRNKDSKPR